jgi:hypothetical protein
MPLLNVCPIDLEGKKILNDVAYGSGLGSPWLLSALVPIRGAQRDSGLAEFGLIRYRSSLPPLLLHG